MTQKEYNKLKVGDVIKCRDDGEYSGLNLKIVEKT